MAEKFLALELPVRMNECGPDGYLRAHICFDYLQHMAAVHAEKMDFGISAVQRRGLIWVLSRMIVHMDAYPRYDDVLRLETYHTGQERIFSKRQYVIKSALTGTRFGYASSFWLILDKNTLRPRPPQSVLDLAEAENRELPEFFPMADKLPVLVDASDPVEHYVSASHIDLNVHLNNTYYSEYALDWVARKLGKHVRFKEIQINYNRAMTFGETLVVTGSLDGNTFAVEGADRGDGKNSFQARGTFEAMD